MLVQSIEDFRRPGPARIAAAFVFSFVLMLSAATISTRSQQVVPPFSIRGKVTDVQGVGIDLTARAELTLFSVAGIRKVQGQRNGEFAIGDLAAGDYELEVRTPGFAPRIIPDLHVASNIEPWPVVMKIDFTYECMHPVRVHYEDSNSDAGKLFGAVAGPGSLDAATVVVERFGDQVVVAAIRPDAKGNFSVSAPLGKYIVVAFRNGDPEQRVSPVWITRTTVAKVYVPFPDPNGGIIGCQ